MPGFLIRNYDEDEIMMAMSAGSSLIAEHDFKTANFKIHVNEKDHDRED